MTFYFWTDEELESLKKMYPRESVPAIRAAIPDRTWMSITVKASRLGIGRTRDHLSLRERINVDPLVNLYGPDGERITLPEEPR